ncbi:MAG TPA: DUF6101 family protein [Pseudolabrys sp.]|nr:DUF6101 family protein [Pseudolabrys sp.]
MRSGGCAGSGRALRLDPFGLPVLFSASDAAADGRLRDIELHRERVVMRRSLAGMRMALNMPIAAFDGISLQLIASENGQADMLAVVLEHRDPSLTFPLFLTSRPDEALAEWRAWSEVLDVPLLLAHPDTGRAVAQLGPLCVERPRPRRRRRSVLKKRRPSILMLRGVGKITGATPVHRGEREIIARN